MFMFSKGRKSIERTEFILLWSKILKFFFFASLILPIFSHTLLKKRTGHTFDNKLFIVKNFVWTDSLLNIISHKKIWELWDRVTDIIQQLLWMMLDQMKDPLSHYIGVTMKGIFAVMISKTGVWKCLFETVGPPFYRRNAVWLCWLWK